MDPDENTPQVDPTFAAGMAAAHGAFSGTHRHAHSTYGAQGDDVTHEHSHTHANDNRHQHEHPAAQQASTPGVWPFGQMMFCRGGVAPAEPVTAAALTAASMAATGSPWGIAHDPDGPWEVLTADGTVAWSQDSYADALARVGEQMAADRPVLAERWRSDMAYEGVSTGDGRYINPGGIEYRDTPLPLMLQTVTEGGHYGAVLAGTILETGKVGATATGAGTFDDSDAGRQFVDIIAARGKFGVSIDVAEAEGEFVCTEYDDEGDCIDGEVRFDLIRVMGLTGTPFPAFEGAYIEIPQAAEPAEPVAAAATPAGAEPCHECGDQFPSGMAEAMAQPITADGGPALAPSRLYANPGLTRPTRTRVEEVDGVLHTYGHLATWNRCHTGYSDRCVPPPHSPTDYAFFNSGPLPTADGQIVHVGQITMGTGHANRSSRTPLNQVMAHYDGGPGAITVADVRLGEDEVGIWFSGVIRPDLTADQVRRFQAEKLSGDWREVQRGQGLEQVALLAGVPVPGFPVHEPHEDGESLAASAGTHAMYDDGRLVVLQASYSVHEPEAWELRAEAQDERIRALEERLEAAERVTAPLRPMAVERIVAGVTA